MKKFLLGILMLLPVWCYADHGAGADLYYKYVTGNKYIIYLSIYHNCNASLPSSKNPQINISDSSTSRTANYFTTVSMDRIDDSTMAANPYCEAYRDSTNCSSSPRGRFPGFKRYLYAVSVDLPYSSDKWIFHFTSAMNPSSCDGKLGRGALGSIVNITDAGNILLDAMLNNSTAPNSSARFDRQKVPVSCINTLASIPQPASDANGDSLYYELVTARTNPISSGTSPSNCTNPDKSVPYATGYSYDKPFGATSVGFNFINSTGTISYTATNTGGYSVATRVFEYRNRVLVGYSTREQMFNITPYCLAPTFSADIDTTTLQGATVAGINEITTCPGSVISFRVPATNPLGDNIKTEIRGIPSGSNVTIQGNNTSNPVSGFIWNTTGVPAGTYNISIFYTPNSCPLPSSAGRTYTIHIVDAGTIKATVTSITNCIYKATVKYEIKDGVKPYTVALLQNGAQLKSYTDTTGIITDSFATGSYTVRLSSAGIPCTKETTFTIKDSGAYPFPPIADSPLHVTYCLNFDSSKALSAHGDTLATLHWYDPIGNLINGTPVPPTDKSGTFYYTVNQQYKTCISASDTITVRISDTACDYAPKIYNVITPNGDGKNDRWVIKNIQTYPKSVVQVYNKLGDKVFESINYQNDWSGDDLPTGVYYYLIRINDINKTNGIDTYKGYLMIKR